MALSYHDGNDDEYDGDGHDGDDVVDDAKCRDAAAVVGPSVGAYEGILHGDDDDGGENAAKDPQDGGAGENVICSVRGYGGDVGALMSRLPLMAMMMLVMVSMTTMVMKVHVTGVKGLGFRVNVHGHGDVRASHDEGSQDDNVEELW